jgi:hypothetical protein
MSQLETIMAIFFVDRDAVWRSIRVVAGATDLGLKSIMAIKWGHARGARTLVRRQEDGCVY